MKDELQTKLVEIITSVQSGIAKAGDFAVEQLPDIAQQYIMFGVVSNVIYSIIQLLAVISFGVLSYKLFTSPNGKDNYGNIKEMHVVSCVAFAVSSITTAFIFIIGLKETLLVLFAPKVWLLLELAKLIR